MEEQKQKSLVQFVRKGLGHRGSSEHSGRGFYMCGIPANVTWDRIHNEVKSKAETWKKKGVVETIEEGIDRSGPWIRVTFDFDIFGNYSQLFVSKWGVENMGQYTIGFRLVDKN